MKPLTEEFFDATEGMMLDADATDYATLTIGGKSVPVSDVTWRFDEDDGPVSEEARINVPDALTACRTVTLTATTECTPQQWDAFMAMMPAPTWPQWLLVEYAGDSAHVPIFEHDTRETLERRIAEAVRRVCAFASIGALKPRCAKWRWRRAKRHEKAAAKRTKMRAARYAARWEQAHLRGGK